MKLAVKWVWWRAVQVGEFFNIERRPDLVEGGGGARYIEIPRSLVPPTQRFLGQFGAFEEPAEATIEVRTIGAPDLILPLEFKRKAGGRLRIANQNRQATPDLRHPAWRSDLGFPRAPDDVASSEEAAAYYPAGGIRIYIVKTRLGEYYAGFKTGFAPATLPMDHPSRGLFQTGIGGLIPGGPDVI